MTTPNRPLVRNAADEGQQQAAKERLAGNEGQLRRAYQAVLATPEGQMVLWDLLEFCAVYRSIWDSSARIHYNAGKQDVGHYVQAQVVEANPKVLVEMMQSKLTK